MNQIESVFQRDDSFRIVLAKPETWVCCYCGKDSGSGVLPQDWNLSQGGNGYCYECWEKAINIPENRFGIVVWDRLKDGCFKEDVE